MPTTAVTNFYRMYSNVIEIDVTNTNSGGQDVIFNERLKFLMLFLSLSI